MIYLIKMKKLSVHSLHAYFLSLTLCLVFFINCGPYSFSGATASHIKTVAIAIFQDQTSEFGVKEALTDAVIEEFTRDNTLKISDRRNADSVVEGAIIRIQDRAGAFTSTEIVEDIKIFITVKVKYEDLKKRKTVWQEEITQWGTFDPDSGPDSRNEGINEAIQKIANEILNKSVSGW